MRRGLAASLLFHAVILALLGSIAAMVDRWEGPQDAPEPAGIEIALGDQHDGSMPEPAPAPPPPT